MTEPAVILKNAAVGYSRRAVLENVNASIAGGDSIGLIGPNGSGKTTLLKSIAGILPLIHGEIQFAGGARPPVGYVPQRESLEHAFLLSSLEVVLMGACGRVGPGRPMGHKERAFAFQCLERTGTAELARKPFAEISGGQKQRVLIARALMTSPELLLLDEPTAGVDHAATAAITELLRKLNAEGITILMVNHDAPVLRLICRTIWRVRDGKLQVGEPNAMLAPASLDQDSIE